jgi:hypothetical protein
MWKHQIEVSPLFIGLFSGLQSMESQEKFTHAYATILFWEEDSRWMN